MHQFHAGNGGYGIMVITGVCGTLNSGSIPDSRPEEEKDYSFFRIVFFDDGRLSGAAFRRKALHELKPD